MIAADEPMFYDCPVATALNPRNKRDWHGAPLVPGRNVDEIDILRGVEEAVLIGYNDRRSIMVVEYALWRWSRGEEKGCETTMLNGGIDMTSAYRIIAAAGGGRT